MKSKWTDSSILKNVSVNEIAFYVARGAKLHPLLYSKFTQQILELEFKRKVCLLPQYKMELYSEALKHRIQTRIAKYLAA